METSDSLADATTGWQQEIRAREDDARLAFLAGDLAALDALWSDDFTVNSPLNLLLAKRGLLEAIRAGRIRHTAYESEIEYMSRYGDVVVVMGRDTVADPPEGRVSRRRFTNVWRLEDGEWRSIARHAHVVESEAPG